VTAALCFLLLSRPLPSMDIWHLARVVEGEGVLTVPAGQRQGVADAMVHTLLNGLCKWDWPCDVETMAQQRFMGYYRVEGPSEEALLLAGNAFNRDYDAANGAAFVFGHQDNARLGWEDTIPHTVWSWEGEGEKFYGYRYFPPYYRRN
jgi:hypothetical protein